MNAPACVTLIAGWAQTEQALLPLAEQLFPDRLTGEPEGAEEVQDPYSLDSDAINITSVYSLLSESRDSDGIADGGAPSAYAAALASQLARLRQPSVLIGWSMGGTVALETAIGFPELVRRLVLISSCARFDPPGNDHLDVRSLPVRAMIVGLHRDRRETLRGFFSLVHSVNGSPALLDESLQQALGLDPNRLVHGLRYLQTVDLRSRLSALRVPTLITHGRRDRVISWQASQLLHDGIGASDLVLAEHGDHGLVTTAPGVLAPAILRFFSADSLLA